MADDQRLDACFAADFSVHGPNGDMTYPELKALSGAMRDAFGGFACERRMILSDGAYVGAATSMPGVFSSRFGASTVGPIEPTGRPMRLELINVFRYDEDGQPAGRGLGYPAPARRRLHGTGVHCLVPKGTC